MSTRSSFTAGLLVTVVVVAGVGGVGYLTYQRAVRESTELYHTATSLYETKQYTQAEEVYKALLHRRTAEAYVPEAHYRLALLAEADERYGEAADYWAKVAAAPGAVAPAEIVYHRGYCAARLGEQDSAAEFFRQVRAGGDNPFTAQAALELGRMAQEAGDREGARLQLEAAVQEAEDRDRDVQLAAGAALRELNLAALRRPAPDAETQVAHVVRPGDNLQSIAARYDSTVELVMEVNGISDPSRLRVGQRLLVPQHNFSIVIDKDDFTLTLYDGDRIFAVYPVGLGKNGCTPVGRFTIKEKIKDPTWWSPNGPVPPGDPENELGTRWMGMQAIDPGIGEGYGIHATIRPETIGTEASNGCPRMYEADAQELFRLIRVGTPVRVDAA